MAGTFLVRDATILTLNPAWDIVRGDLFVENGRIAAIGPAAARPRVPAVDAAGDVLLPGFVQTHVHLCQTLFRGLADDLPLLEWLRRRIWPLEAAHTPRSLAAAARLAAAELVAGGTTTVLTMETTHDTDAVFEAIAAAGLRAVIGKSLMDADDSAPARLREPARQALDEGLALATRWHGHAGGRLRAALAPRFALSCSRDLLEDVAAAARQHALLVHTHAAEHHDEVTLVREQTGLANVEYLAAVGLLSPRACLAHCVWVDADDQRLLAEHGARVLHCPGSNLKLGSGVAPVVELRAQGVCVSLGADGAACNNRLDMFREMRLAATLQAVRHRPGILPAREVVAMATREGARALGLLDDIGTIEVGKRADLVLVGQRRLHAAPLADPYSTLVYAAGPADVRAVWIDGQQLVDEGRPTRWDVDEIRAAAGDEARALVNRAGL